jgi:hypothetical protein
MLNRLGGVGGGAECVELADGVEGCSAPRLTKEHCALSIPSSVTAP